ncbi:MAG: hypothetical protein COZ05_08330, partial [Armatimonadetes bacterium CG_4_10_14_3_um_filter_59_10]
EGLAHLKEMDRLTHLQLAETGITDEGLAHIPAMRSIVRLNLAKTAITDACLKHLAMVRGLQEVDLSGTNVTSEGYASLQAQLPRLTLKGRPGDLLAAKSS